MQPRHVKDGKMYNFDLTNLTERKSSSKANQKIPPPTTGLRYNNWAAVWTCGGLNAGTGKEFTYPKLPDRLHGLPSPCSVQARGLSPVRKVAETLA
jgi:hypothetical protein